MRASYIAPMRITILTLGCVLLTGCLVPPEEDPVYQKQVEIENRVARVEHIVDNQGLTNLTNEIEALRKENEELRNQVETLQNAVNQGVDRQRQQYQDIDQRLQGLERRGAPAAGAESAVGAGVAATGAAAGGAIAASAATPGADKAAYQAAFVLLKEGRYEQATAAFRKFLADYPDSTLLDNGQYWLGESIYVTQKFKEALPEFEAVTTKYPQSRKIPDALLKIGYCNYELKRYDAARTALTSVVNDYKETTAARLAGQRLQQMKAEGH